MAAINQQFNLRFNTSPLDDFIRKAERAAEVTDAQISSVEKLGDSVTRTAKVAPEVWEAWMRSADSLEQTMGKLGVSTDQAAQKQEELCNIAAAAALQSAEAETAAAQKRMEAQFQASQAALKARDQEEKAARQAEKANKKVTKSVQDTEKAAKKAGKSFLDFGKAANPLEKLAGRLTRTALTLFSVQRVLQAITSAMERAPDKIAAPFSALGTSLKDGFARSVVSFMSGMQSGVEKLNKALNSKSGQTLFRGLERAMQLAGNAIGKLLEGAAALVEFLGSHAQEVFLAAALALGVFTAGMVAANISTLAAAAPILLIVGLCSALVFGLMKAGITAEDIFTAIGTGAGFLYALVYNIAADAWNLFAAFSEFFANVFNDPVAAVVHLFIDAFDVILSVVETAAKAIDALTGSSLSAAVSGFRGNLQSWADENFGEKEIRIERMEKKSYSDTASAWGEKFGDIMGSFSLDALGEAAAPELKSIQSGTSAIRADTSALRKEVSLAQEDIKSLVDIAERRYINNINLTTQRPIIHVNGANTGRTAEDRQAMADAIREVLIEQTSSGSYVATAIP